MADHFSNADGPDDRVGRAGPVPKSLAWRWPAVLLLLLSLSAAPRVARGGTLVSFNTTLGTYQVDLFNDVVPETVSNFVSYVNASAFSNTGIHRSITSGIGIIQGGGYTFNSQSGLFEAISKGDEIPLQSLLPNKRGTIAMARTSDPNSATSEWFINTVDNSDQLNYIPPNPPIHNGSPGYAVFGWVVSGMDVVDAIQALPTTLVGVADLPFDHESVPVRNYAGGAVTAANLIFTNSATVVKTHPTFQNPLLNTDMNNDGSTSTQDALLLINRLLAFGSHEASTEFLINDFMYGDINGNGQITPNDLNILVNALLAQGATAAAPQAAPLFAPAAAPLFAAVPEPSSLALCVAAVLALSAGAAGRFRRRRVSGPAR